MIRPRIDRPCPKTWDALTGSGPTRHCTDCQRAVHRLDGRSDAEIAALLDRPGRKCVAYAVRPGQISVPAARWRFLHRVGILRPLSLLLTALVAVFCGGCAAVPRQNAGDEPPAACAPPAPIDDDADGKTFVTIGVVIDERPFWKRWLGLD